MDMINRKAYLAAGFMLLMLALFFTANPKSRVMGAVIGTDIVPYPIAYFIAAFLVIAFIVVAGTEKLEEKVTGTKERKGILNSLFNGTKGLIALLVGASAIAPMNDASAANPKSQAAQVYPKGYESKYQGAPAQSYSPTAAEMQEIEKIKKDGVYLSYNQGKDYKSIKSSYERKYTQKYRNQAN